MECPQCKFENPPAAVRCQECGTPLEDEGATLTDGPTEVWSSRPSGSGVRGVPSSPSAVRPGAVLGGRYEIQQLLGEGGMGAVYKARDRELDRLVALKVILPELMKHPDILHRFKQELILARKVTHKNVIRIFDLGEAEGTKFFTMEYVEGQDLKTLLREKGKFAPEEAAGIIRQICRALNAAHEEGVVHRDLKPQNIMLDKKGTILVMDFGIARSMEVTGFTQTGALIGTPDYMSPEQAKSEKVDTRSDLFTLGIIFYELVTGKAPYQADTALASLLKRTQGPPAPPAELDQTIPLYLSNVILKCLQIDPQHRYQTAREILQDLEARTASRTRTSIPLSSPFKFLAGTRARLAAGVVALLLAIAGIAFREDIWRGFGGTPGVSEAPLSLAILPFHNASGDQSLDWLGAGLAEMLATDVGQSAHFRTVSSGRLSQILKDLRITSASTLDSSILDQVAEFSRAEILVWGKYIRLGDRIQIDATIRDRKRQRAIPLKAEAPSEAELLTAVAQLAESIRENLDLSSEMVEELQAKSFQPSTDSLPALRAYNEGLELARQGNHLEAAKKFQASIDEDVEFALAHARLGQAYATLGYDSEAEQFSRKAADLSESLSLQERNLILANHARIVNDLDQALEAYENLAASFPFDSRVQFELAGLYEAKGAFDAAREHYAKVLENDPAYVDALYAAGRVEIKARNAQGSLDFLNRGLSLAIQLDNQESKATILHAIGVAYKFLNKPSEALRYYRESLGLKQEIGDKRGMATSLVEIAQMQELAAELDVAQETYEKALAIQREIGDKKGIGLTLMNLGILLQDRGRYDESLAFSKESLQVHIELGDQDYQAFCQNNIGTVYFHKGQYTDAVTYYQQALQLREKLGIPGEIAETLYNLGETSSRMGRYNQALTRYLRALELWREAGDKRGLAVTSYGLGTLFGYQGRYGAAVDAMEEALESFQDLQERSSWLGEIRAGYGRALSLVGRSQEAQGHLDAALSLARELQNDLLIARTLNFQGDRFFYQGDYKSARPLYNQAQRVASRADDRHLILLSKFNLAKVAVKEGRARAAIKALRTLASQADALGLKYISSQGSIYLGEALLNNKNYARAQKELEAALAESEKLGLRAQLTKANFLLAKVLPFTGDEAGATRHLQKAFRVLEEIRSEARSDALLQRVDLAPIYRESTALSQRPAN